MNEHPELSDGHARIANEIMESLARTYMSSYESQFLWCLFRKTYGWGKKDDWLPLSQIAAATGMHRSHVSRTKRKLINRRIVTQTGNKISFNKYWSQWKELPKQVTFTQIGNIKGVVPKQVTGGTQIGGGVVPKQVPSKDNYSKDNYQKILSSSKKGTPHPGVQAIMEAMKECFGTMDDSELKNRRYAWLLLKKAKMNIEGCVTLARAASKHSWWKSRITRVEDLYRHAHKIANALREEEAKPAHIAFIS